MSRRNSPPIDPLNLTTNQIPITEGRVVEVQPSYLEGYGQKRIRVIDDYETSYAATLAEVLVVNESAAEAVTWALQVTFGATSVIDGEPFHPKDTSFRYRKS